MAACRGRWPITSLIRRNPLFLHRKKIHYSPIVSSANGFLKKDNLCLVEKRWVHNSVVLWKLTQFILSDPGEGIKEVTIKKWFVKPGDEVNHFDDLCEAESDKATMTITSPYEGIVKKIYYEEDSVALVGNPLIDFETSDDDETTTTEVKQIVQESQKLASDADEKYSSPTNQISGKKLATPAVRNMAMENNVNLNDVTGTGEAGRILKEDILNFIKKDKTDQEYTTPHPEEIQAVPTETSAAFRSPITTAPVPAIPPPLVEDRVEKITGFKKAMLKTMSEALKIPHFGYSDEVVLNKLISFRENAKELSLARLVKLSFMPMFIKAASLALNHYPILNSTVDENCDNITYKASHNIGVAMDTRQGLVVPNIKNVQNKSIFEIAKELKTLQELAAAAKFEMEHLQSGTFTLSNIGSIGGTYCDPIILPPQVVIGALGKAQVLPRYNENEEIYKAHVMCISWSADHRVIDGATICRFSNLWKSYLENPATMLLDLR